MIDTELRLAALQSGRLTAGFITTKGVPPMTIRRSLLTAMLALAVLVSACAPEVGSEAWCEALAEKPRGDWTANEAVDYARHCIIR